MFPKDEIDQLVQKVETSQRKSRQRALIAIAIPTIAATLYLGMTLALVLQKQQELQTKNQEITQKTAEVVRLDQKIKERNQELQQYKTFVQQDSPRAPYELQNTPPKVTLGSSSAPELVYIQIRNPAQQEKAQKIATALQSKGYLVPRIEQVTIGPSKTSQVRYFRPEDQEKAVQLVKILQELHVQDPIKPSPTSTDRANLKHLEIWFSPNF